MKKIKVSAVVTYAILIIMAFVAIFPIYFMIIASFKDTSDLFRNGIKMVFEFDNLTRSNYVYTLTAKNHEYLIWYLNSIVVLVASTIFSLGLSSIGGYAIGAYDFKGRKFIFVLTMIVMMIPIEILLIPLYRMIINMKLIDTKTGSILPFVVQPTAMFFFQQYVRGLDRGYMEAARVDGCTEFGIYVRIMVPMMRPAFGAMLILLALRNWNAFLWPMIVFSSETSYTLPVGLASLISSYGNNYEMLIPGAVMAFIPLIIIFLANQNQFVSGLTVGGIKG